MEGINSISIRPLDDGDKGYVVILQKDNPDPGADVPIIEEEWGFTNFTDMASFISGLNGA